MIELLEFTQSAEIQISKVDPQNESALAAETDSQAVTTWIAAKGSRSGNTLVAYRREAMRLLLWLGEQHMTLNEMKVEHANAFFSHLGNPPADWIRPRKPRRGESLLVTQVLVKALANESIDYTRTVLGQMCSYLQDAGYLQRNVFHLSIKPPVLIKTVPTRFLDLTSWQWLWKWIEDQRSSTRIGNALIARSRWPCSITRASVVTKRRMGDFMRRDNAWTLQVIGKGKKERSVTVNSVLLQELIRYRKAVGLDGYPVPNEKLPLILSTKAARRMELLTPRIIGAIVSMIAQDAANDCDDPHIRAQIVQLSAHWLRHTNATHRLMAGASLETTQDELGHASPQTTRLYAKTTGTGRQIDAEKLATLMKD
jgi:integrase/recombinase XerC